MSTVAVCAAAVALVDGRASVVRTAACCLGTCDGGACVELAVVDAVVAAAAVVVDMVVVDVVVVDVVVVDVVVVVAKGVHFASPYSSLCSVSMFRVSGSYDCTGFLPTQPVKSAFCGVFVRFVARQKSSSMLRTRGA